MTPVVAVIAPGAMGSAVAKRLTENGVTVLTNLDGRSAGSIARSNAAGMKAASLDDVAGADIILSIVPPGEALGLAQRLTPVLAHAKKKPVYADCNAVSPDTVREIAAVIAGAHCRFVDGGIIGGPPKAGATGPRFYLSGERAASVAVLEEFGLECPVLKGPIGAASALKMSYGGITKGLTALGSIMILGAARAGQADTLKSELAHSQPQLLAWFEKQIPSMFSKAYRWVAEMEEVAGFLDEDSAGAPMFECISEFYERMAEDFADAKDETGELARFFKAQTE